MTLAPTSSEINDDMGNATSNFKHQFTYSGLLLDTQSKICWSADHVKVHIGLDRCRDK